MVMPLNKPANNKSNVPTTNPLTRCNKCQKFGHTASTCHSKINTCPHCAGNHTHHECQSDYKKCANCHGRHSAAYKGCKLYRKIESLTCHQLIKPEPIKRKENKINLDINTLAKELVGKTENEIKEKLTRFLQDHTTTPTITQRNKTKSHQSKPPPQAKNQTSNNVTTTTKVTTTAAASTTATTSSSSSTTATTKTSPSSSTTTAPNKSVNKNRETKENKNPPKKTTKRKTIKLTDRQTTPRRSERIKVSKNKK